mmetsp:Transcript_16915/g.52547  ORF Transcript_16915/g.52547 Transcript_16915/m.52547 type:complete len:220 (-) Transcript_16915:2034-2693(-)
MAVLCVVVLRATPRSLMRLRMLSTASGSSTAAERAQLKSNVVCLLLAAASVASSIASKTSTARVQLRSLASSSSSSVCGRSTVACSAAAVVDDAASAWCCSPFQPRPPFFGALPPSWSPPSAGVSKTSNSAGSRPTARSAMLTRSAPAGEKRRRAVASIASKISTASSYRPTSTQPKMSARAMRGGGGSEPKTARAPAASSSTRRSLIFGSARATEVSA